MDAQRPGDYVARVVDHGLEVADYFHPDWFEPSPGYRSLYPASISCRHQALLDVLACVDNVDELRHFSGPSWSQELEKDRVTACGVLAEVMVRGGAEA